MGNFNAHAGYYICIRKPIDIMSTKKNSTMNQSIVLTPHVINTINSLPTEERYAIATALAGEILLGANIDGELTAQQQMIYSIIRDYIRRDTARVFA